MERDSFVLYTRFYDLVKNLTLEQKGMLFDAIHYFANGDDYEIGDVVAEMAFRFYRNQLEMDFGKWDDVRKKRSEAGKMGGRPRKPQENPDETQTENKRKQTKAKKAVNVNVNVNDNNRETNVSQKTIKTRKKEDLENYDKPTKEENDRFTRLLNRYNAILSEMGSSINRVVMLTPYRVERLRRLVVDFSDEQIERGFRQAAASSYLNGRTKERERPADFDWIIDFDNFVKIYEGCV